MGGCKRRKIASQGFLLVGGCCLARCRQDFGNLKWPPVVSYTVQIPSSHLVSFDLISSHLISCLTTMAMATSATVAAATVARATMLLRVSNGLDESTDDGVECGLVWRVGDSPPSSTRQFFFLSSF